MRPAVLFTFCLLAVAAALLVAACRPALRARSAEPVALRVATFNGSLYDAKAGGLIARLEAGDEAARKIAAVIQHRRPDLLLLNEFDYDAGGRAADLFEQRYLGVGQSGQAPIRYPHRYFAPVNTGVPSGMDLDRDGSIGGPNDALGFGLHPGQYGMLVLSRYPIDRDAVRSFQTFPWKDLPGARSPVDPGTGKPWYPPEVWSKFRLSSKSHWDVPVQTRWGCCISSCTTRPRRSSTAPRIATACAIATRSVSGPSTFRSGPHPGSATTRGAAADCRATRCS